MFGCLDVWVYEMTIEYIVKHPIDSIESAKHPNTLSIEDIVASYMYLDVPQARNDNRLNWTRQTSKYM